MRRVKNGSWHQVLNDNSFLRDFFLAENSPNFLKVLNNLCLRDTSQYMKFFTCFETKDNLIVAHWNIGHLIIIILLYFPVLTTEIPIKSVNSFFICSDKKQKKRVLDYK